MNEWFKNISLFRIIAGMFIGFLLLALTNYLVIKSYVEGLKSDALEIDVAGKTRMLSQKILLLVNEMDTDPSVREELYGLLSEHENIFEAFKSGGIIKSSNKFITPVSGMGEVVLRQSTQLWDSIHHSVLTLLESPLTVESSVTKTRLISSGDSLGTMVPDNFLETVTIPNPVVSKAKRFLNRNRNEFLASNNRFVQSLVARNNERQSSLYAILLGFLLFNSVCIMIVLYATRRFIFNPLRDVASTAKRLALGEVGIKLNYPFENELGKIANGLNHLSHNLETARIFIEKIEKGDLDEGADSFDRKSLKQNSIESALIKMRDQMQIRAQEDEVRSWTTQGLAKFVDILRSSNNMNELGDAILSNLTAYTNSNQAGLYLLNDNDESNKHLELVSLYAFKSKKFDIKSYRLGEGLVGQTFLEKKTLYFIEVPNDYISITSGLGETNPKSLLLVPLKVEEDVYGVIEIASFNEYEEHQIKFIERLSENIASTISAVKTNEKTKVLLQESQQLTEQMQAQEEEMRQNMEELTATQEEMARKEKAVNSQIDTINEVVGMAEYSTDGSILSTNQKLNEALNYTDQNIAKASFNNLHADTNLLEEIITNKNWSGWTEKINSNGQLISFKSQFTLIEDESGYDSKIIEIVSQFEKEVIKEASNETFELDEVQEELQQNLDALELTQEQLTARLDQTENIFEGLQKVAYYIVFSETGEVSETSSLVFDEFAEFSNINDIIEEPLSMLISESDTLNINIKGKKEREVSAVIRKLNAANNFMIIWT